MISRKKPASSNSGRTQNKVKPIPHMIENKSAVAFSPTKDDTGKHKTYFREDSEEEQRFHSQVERFIEISKYFSSPLRKTATYMCENNLVSYPNPLRIEFQRSGVTTHNLKFCNHTSQAVFVRLFKIIPDLEQIKFINLPLSRSKRIPPGLSFNLGFVYDDVNEKEIGDGKMIFVASRKSMTPCYQICEIDLQIMTKGRPSR